MASALADAMTLPLGDHATPSMAFQWPGMMVMHSQLTVSKTRIAASLQPLARACGAQERVGRHVPDGGQVTERGGLRL